MHDIREWISDNLRYILLGGLALVLLLVLIFTIHSCAGRGSSDGADTSAQDTSILENTDDGSIKYPLETASKTITALVKEYYKALGDKDIEALKSVQKDFVSTDEPKVKNAEYIEGYKVNNVYTKAGLDEDTYVTYAELEYTCKGISTAVPALSELYVVKDDDGSMKILAAVDSDQDIRNYMDSLLDDSDLKQLINKVNSAYEQAKASDESLSSFLAGLGQETVTETTDTLMTASDDCNIRQAADPESDVIDTLSAGAQVTVIGTEGEWYQIDYNGQTGYVHQTLLTE